MHCTYKWDECLEMDLKDSAVGEWMQWSQHCFGGLSWIKDSFYFYTYFVSAKRNFLHWRVNLKTYQTLCFPSKITILWWGSKEGVPCALIKTCTEFRGLTTVLRWREPRVSGTCGSVLQWLLFNSVEPWASGLRGKADLICLPKAMI